ncbi:MAG: hypothetical protein SGI77_22805 [Pirellulaceae bacterium]|nr:hypothetical protein [Pirellulaceae bacterium]
MKSLNGECDWESRMNLIRARGRKLGLEGADLDDAVQDVAMAILKFRYDPLRSNGASEKTALIHVMDRRLISFLRSKGRRLKHVAPIDLQNTNESKGLESQDRTIDINVIQSDVRLAMLSIDELQHRVCRLLMAGLSQAKTQAELGLSRREMCRHMKSLRDAFAKHGFSKCRGD